MVLSRQQENDLDVQEQVTMRTRSQDVPTDIRKLDAYGQFARNARWRDDLHRRAAHKALDIPEDDMEIQSHSGNVVNNNGIGWKELLILAALGIGGAGATYGIINAINSGNTSVSPPVSESGGEGDYLIRFYDSNGEEIQLTPLPAGEANESGQE